MSCPASRCAKPADAIRRTRKNFFINLNPSEKKIMESPFSGKQCVWYRYTVEEYRTTGKHHYWATVKNGDSGVPFFVKDETGSVLVNPKGAEADIPMDYECNSGFG